MLDGLCGEWLRRSASRGALPPEGLLSCALGPPVREMSNNKHVHTQDEYVNMTKMLTKHKNVDKVKSDVNK